MPVAVGVFAVLQELRPFPRDLVGDVAALELELSCLRFGLPNPNNQRLEALTAPFINP